VGQSVCRDEPSRLYAWLWSWALCNQLIVPAYERADCTLMKQICLCGTSNTPSAKHLLLLHHPPLLLVVVAMPLIESALSKYLCKLLDES
jgi:hypothetical protein